MRPNVTLYSYADSWSNQIHSRNLNKTVKQSYIFKSLLLLLLLPLDILYLVVISPFQKQCDVFFATEKWPGLIEAVSNEVNVASISPPVFILKNFRSNIRYIPASIFYVPAAIGLFLPRSLHPWWSNFTISLAKKLLSHFSERNAALVVHSDALPFGRGLVLAANELGIKSVCIQHGIFRGCNIIGEQDGFLCAHNIVRSAEDAAIIAASSEQTIIHVLQDFFKLEVIESCKKLDNLTVLFLGEGYQIVDPEFNCKYLAHLELIQAQLIDHGVNVIFRPHPSERGVRWTKRFQKINTDSLEICMGSVDAVVGYSSTVLQESAEAGISVFYVDPLSCGHKIIGRNDAIIHEYTGAKDLISCVNHEKKMRRDFPLRSNNSTVHLDFLNILTN